LSVRLPASHTYLFPNTNYLENFDPIWHERSLSSAKNHYVVRVKKQSSCLSVGFLSDLVTAVVLPAIKIRQTFSSDQMTTIIY
jgi:hypothetical protein